MDASHSDPCQKLPPSLQNLHQNRNLYSCRRSLVKHLAGSSPSLTRVSHLPENVRLQDLGHMAGDGAEQTPAGVAARGMPETRSQREAGPSEGAGRLPRLPFWSFCRGVARRRGFRSYRDETKQKKHNSLTPANVVFPPNQIRFILKVTY